MDSTPFEFNVHTFTQSSPDKTLYSTPKELFGDGDDLWSTRKSKLEFIANFKRMAEDIGNQDPDVLHFIQINFASLLLLKRIDFDGRVIFGPNIGGWFPNRVDKLWLKDTKQELKHKLKYQIRKQYLKATSDHQFVAFSHYHADMLECTGLSKENITVLKPGVHSIFSPNQGTQTILSEIERKSREKETLKLLYVGPKTEYKGYNVFLRALEKVDNVEAKVIGGGNPQLDLIRSLDLEDRVDIQGFVPRELLPQEYNSADVVVIPTIDETAGPNIQIEALACGTPVVLTDVPGMNEYAESDSVVYFPTREPEAIANAIEQAAQNIVQLTESALDNVHRYNAKVTIEQLASLYREINSQ
ncbi:glycosyltransferase family 4 protein [Halorubrum sp. C191]|uniref:glycosyltransferase family 4 protein n=1 Tax=Halorubrum sp. C191 TaxID=1383842 RepID=UPI0013043D20|nr:glycosyltransferase family 4 protein [Halorubrum sp. C191]